MLCLDDDFGTPNPLDEAAHTMRAARPKLPSAGTKP